jgi:hypothetical protein
LKLRPETACQHIDVKNTCGWTDIEDLLFDGSNRALVTSSDHVDWMNFWSNETFKHRVMKQKITSNLKGFIFPVNHFAFKTYNNIIVQMVEGGLIEFYSRNTSKIKVVVENHEDVSLSFEHIGIWLVIWAVFLGFAFLSFLVEVTAKSFFESAEKKLKKVCLIKFKKKLILIYGFFFKDFCR